MSTIESKDKRCVVVGASQAGVTISFALRSEGWEGEIILLDSDTNLPYYRPPLSKAVLTGAESIDDHILKPLSLYERENISLKLGCTVKSINKADKKIILRDDSSISYDKLVLATGSRPIIPKIKNIDETPKLYTLRTAEDVKKISSALANSKQKRVVLIGGGYVGLETAASLKKLGASVTVLEREDRVLARVTAPEMSQYFESLHTENGVNIHTNKNVNAFEVNNESTSVVCQDGSTFEANIVIIGVGVFVNKELAEEAGLEISNGIKVDSSTKTSDDSIYAIGDCTNHYNALYGRHIRLESIQNANDQAKVAAAVICGKEANYNALPWFWSDQFDVKLQMVGLYKGANEVLIRDDDAENHKFSVWYFKDDTLLAVDAVNNTKAYVMGTKFIKGGNKINKAHLVDTSVDFKPANILAKD